MTEGEVIPLDPKHHSLAENEAIIRRGLSTFVEVGTALREIRDEGQYRDAGFDDFDNYVQARWAIGKRSAYDQIAAAEVCSVLHASELPIPASIRAALPLVRHLNDKGGYDHKTHQLRWPDRGVKAVIEAWRGVVEAHVSPDEPITGPEVSRHLYPPVNVGTSASWLVAIGTVGDKLAAAAKSMDRAEQMVGDRSSPRVREKAERYANQCDELAARLRAIGKDTR